MDLLKELSQAQKASVERKRLGGLATRLTALVNMWDRIRGLRRAVAAEERASDPQESQLAAELAKLEEHFGAKLASVHAGAMGARSSWAKRIQSVKPITDIVAFVIAIAGAGAGAHEYFKNQEKEIENHAKDIQNHEKERREAAERAYREVDDKYTDFMRLCLQYPRLDCYSEAKPGRDVEAQSPNEKTEQERLNTVLIDVLEFAYKRYHDDAFVEAIGKESFNDEWPGWKAYVEKLLPREHFRKAWCSIGDEYSGEFVHFMTDEMTMMNLAACPIRPATTSTAPAIIDLR